MATSVQSPVKTCIVDGCEKKQGTAKGLCRMHYYRQHVTGTLEARPKVAPRFCSVEGCPKRAHDCGMCATHAKRFRTRGTTDAPPRRADSPETHFIPGAAFQEIPLTRGKVALVDTEDYERISAFRWFWSRANSHSCEGHEGYAKRNASVRESRRSSISMHSAVMQPPPGKEVDHIRISSGLDNRKENLRVVDHAANIRNRRLLRSNTSGFRGVSACSDTAGKWIAKIRHEGKYLHLGTFDSAEAAAAAYEAARERLGLLKAQSDH